MQGLIMACHDCDLIQQIGEVPDGGAALCIRCGATLFRKKRNSVDRTLALSLAGAVLFVIANTYPFLGFKAGAKVQETTLITGVKTLYTQGMTELSILVFLTTVLLPLMQLGGMIYLHLPLKLNRRPYNLPLVLRYLQHIRPWSMMEVFMLGILVSVVKLAKMATLVPGLALYAFLVLIFVIAASLASLDTHLIWEEWEKTCPTKE
jgi:paraquat-inducible protein A